MISGMTKRDLNTGQPLFHPRINKGRGRQKDVCFYIQSMQSFIHSCMHICVHSSIHMLSRFFSLSILLSIYRSFLISVSLSVCEFYLSIFLFIYLFIYLFMHLLIYEATYLSIYLLIFINLSIHLFIDIQRLDGKNKRKNRTNIGDVLHINAKARMHRHSLVRELTHLSDKKKAGAFHITAKSEE